MADYIFDFTLTGINILMAKYLQVSVYESQFKEQIPPKKTKKERIE
jgi:hypothetical protein